MRLKKQHLKRIPKEVEKGGASPQPQIVQRDEDKDNLEEGPFFLGENEMGKDNWQFEPLPAEFYFLHSGLDEPCKWRK
jgi:hypothetical protein